MRPSNSKWQPITTDGANSPPPSMPAYFDDPYAARMEEAKNRSPRTSRDLGVTIRIPPPISGTVTMPNLMQSFRAVAERVDRARRPLPPQSKLWRDYISTLRQEQALQNEVQELLDAQEAGLTRVTVGRGSSNVGSSRAESVSGRGYSSLSGREHPKKSLRSTRLSLLKALHELSVFAAQKNELLLAAYGVLRQAFDQLEDWNRKLVDIDERAEQQRRDNSKSTRIDSGQSNDRKIRELEDGIRLHEREIAQLKVKVAEKKSQLRSLRQMDEERKSTMEAKLARFTHAKREVELEAQRWLAHPPDDIFVPSQLLDTPTAEQILDLNPSRRTVESAYQFLKTVVPFIEGKLEETEAELEACELGNDTWEEALETILTFESELARWIKGRGGGVSKAEMIERMEAVGTHLEEALEVAQNEGWTLLVCILGAEVEAWKEGEEVLRELLGEKGKKRQADNGKGRGRSAVMTSMDDDDTGKAPLQPDEFLKEPLQPAGRGRGLSAASTTTSEGIWGPNYNPPMLQNTLSSHAADLAEVQGRSNDGPGSNVVVADGPNKTPAPVADATLPNTGSPTDRQSEDQEAVGTDTALTARSTYQEPSFRTARERSRSRESKKSVDSHHSIEMEGLKISDSGTAKPTTTSRYSSPRIGSPMVGSGSGSGIGGARSARIVPLRRGTDGADEGESDGEPPADLLV